MAVNTSRMDEEQQSVPKRKTILRLLKYLLAYKKRILLVLCIMAGTISISMITPLLMEKAINDYVAMGDRAGLLRLGGGAVILFCLFLAGTKARMYIMADISNQILVTIRNQLFDHIQTLSFRFFDSRPTGKILAPQHRAGRPDGPNEPQGLSGRPGADQRLCGRQRRRL